MNSKAEEQRLREKDSKIDSKQIYQGKIVSLKVEIFEWDGKPHKTEIVEHPGAVVLIPIDGGGRILLVKQWRRAIQQITIELPAGKLEKGEAPLICAQRELQEETGFKAEELIPFGSFYTAPGFCNEYLHLYIARGLAESVMPADDDEGIDLFPVTLDQAMKLIETNEICDAKTIAGILRYQFWKKSQ